MTYRNCFVASAMLFAASAIAAPIAGPGVVNMTPLGHWDGFRGSYADIWAEGDIAYMGHFGSPGVDILDVSDPSNPVHLLQYDLPVSGSAQDVKVHDGLLFIGVEGSNQLSVHIVDVRNPASPVPLVDVSIAGYMSIHNVFYCDGYLYLADSNTTRVGIVDLTGLDPDDPPSDDITSTLWTVENVGTSIVHDITVVNDRLYAAAWDSGIWVYDVANLATQPPTLLGNGPGENTHSCWPTADGQYVITGEERSGGGILVYRMTDDGNGGLDLEITDQIALPTSEASSVHNQWTIGHRVYNSWYGAGLRVYDVDPATGLLEFVASYDTNQTNSTWGVYPALGQDRILISDIGSGLWTMSLDLPLPGDVDGDGIVGVTDLVGVILSWGPCLGCPADLNGDGVVNVEDLLAVILNWS